MSLKLAIKVDYDVATKQLKVTELEVSGESWGDGGNPIRADIEKATINVYFNEQLTKSENVTTQLTNATLDNLPVLDVKEDGIYVVGLTVEVDGVAENVVAELQLVLVTAEVEKWISKFWAKHACTSNLERQKGIFDVVSKLELLLGGTESLSIINQRPECIETLSIIQKLIKLNTKLLK